MRRLIPTYLNEEAGTRCVVAYFTATQAFGLCGSASLIPGQIHELDGAVFYREPAPISYFELPTCDLCIGALETWDSM